MRSAKRPLLNSYELEIKATLLLLVGFLLSIGFLSSYTLGKARQAQENDFAQRVDLAVAMLQDHIERNAPPLPDPAFLDEVCSHADLVHLEITDTLDWPLVAVASQSLVADDSAYTIFRQVTVSGRDKHARYHLKVRAFNSQGKELGRLLYYDALLRLLGLLSGLATAVLFARSVIDPYRRIKKEAKRLNIPLHGLRAGDDVGYVLRFFEEIIAQLKQKEAVLQSMYDNSEKRADSLARYNEYILGSISTGVIICDNQGVITRFNRSARRILGYDEKPTQGRHFAEVFGKGHEVAQILRAALANKTYSRKEIEITRDDGQKLWLGLSSSLITDNEGHKLGAAVLLTDLTRVKHLQQLADYREKMSALGEMSSGLAHELRNSVAAIVGFGKLLKKHISPDDRSFSLVESIISESLATEEMLTRFLDFARPLRPALQDVDLSQLIGDSLKLAEEYQRGKQVRLIRDIPASLPPIRVDPLLLKNALANLVINAYQAIPERGEVSVTCRFDEKEEKFTIQVTDDGVGISQENLGKIFNPFFTTKEKGTGLGLAMVKKIISTHLGSIEVTSAPGQGTTVSVVLPRGANELQVDFEMDQAMFATCNTASGVEKTIGADLFDLDAPERVSLGTG